MSSENRDYVTSVDLIAMFGKRLGKSVANLLSREIPDPERKKVYTYYKHRFGVIAEKTNWCLAYPTDTAIEVVRDFSCNHKQHLLSLWVAERDRIVDTIQDWRDFHEDCTEH